MTAGMLFVQCKLQKKETLPGHSTVREAARRDQGSGTAAREDLHQMLGHSRGEDSCKLSSYSNPILQVSIPPASMHCKQCLPDGIEVAEDKILKLGR